MIISSNLSDEALNLARDYGGDDFIDYIMNEFIPNVNRREKYILRSDYPDKDRNVVTTAWQIYRKSYPTHNLIRIITSSSIVIIPHASAAY